MQFTIEKQNQEAWIAEIRSQKKQFPFFAIPAVIADKHDSNEVSSNTIYHFNLNPVLIATNPDLSQLYSPRQHNIIGNVLNITEAKRVNLNINSKSNNKEHINNGSTLIEPLSGADFYKAKGVNISNELPDKDSLSSLQTKTSTTMKDADEESNEQSLLVQMSFSEWLRNISEKKRKEKEDLKEQELLKNKWKQQKLAEAIQEENEEIPEQVFQMAVDSIEKEESLVSESLAEVYKLQGKYEQAISMYRKLILLNPEKKFYFADKIEQLQKT